MIDILRSVKKVGYSFLSMRLRLCISGLVSLLLALTAYGASFSSPQRDVEPSPSRPQSPVGTSLVLSDLDGDGLVDQATLGMGGWQNSIELDLSRTGELAVLRFSSKTGEYGSLFAQDLDGDGDTDLLWRGVLPPLHYTRRPGERRLFSRRACTACAPRRASTAAKCPRASPPARSR